MTAKAKRKGKPEKSYRVDGAFIAIRYDMLRSLTYRSLSPIERDVLRCIEIEYAKSGGRENGNIKCPNRKLRDFCSIGAQTAQRCLTNLAKLGFIHLKCGVSGPEGYGRSATVGLTYLPKVGTNIGPTDEWKKSSTTATIKAAKSKAEQLAKPPSSVSPPCTCGSTIGHCTCGSTMYPLILPCV